MPDTGADPQDAYPEPRLGTREEAVKALLRMWARTPERFRVNSAASSATGLCLDGRFVHLLDVKRALEALGPSRERRAVELYYLDDRDNATVARMMALSIDTVIEHKRLGIQAIVRDLWCDPSHVTERRAYRASA